MLSTMFFGIPKSMFYLIMAGTFLDNIADVVVYLRDENILMLFVFLFYVLLSCLTILNMLIGVLCEVVSSVSANELEKALVLDTQRQLLHVYEQSCREDGDKISEDDFKKMGANPVVEIALGQIGVQPKHFNALSTSLFLDEARPGEVRELDFEDFVSRVVRLRPEKNASVMDVADLRFCLRSDVVHCKESHATKLKALMALQKSFEHATGRFVRKLKSLEERIERAELRRLRAL